MMAATEPGRQEQVNIARIESVTRQLLNYCQREDWFGYDPYDALNSALLAPLLQIDWKWPRLMLTQLLKRSPINLRPVLRVPKTENPKALALALSAVIKLERVGLIRLPGLVDELAERILAHRSPSSYWCWGYSFPWQGRHFLVPAGAPNLVCTVFVAEALLDVLDETDDGEYLNISRSCADYILDTLYWRDNEVASFSYPTPAARARVHNANLLAAAFLCRIAKLTSETRYREIALTVARYSVARQNVDGSWYYGENSDQTWIDNFHTGYNLSALRRIQQFAGTTEFEDHLERGYDFYRTHFFREDGAPRYFHNRSYPLDVHCVAQSIITLLDFADYDDSADLLAARVLDWCLQNLWDKKGCFYYQQRSWGTIKIPYMRWAETWMLLALASFLENERSVV